MRHGSSGTPEGYLRTRAGTFDALLKRATDIVLTVPIVVLAAPLVLLIAVAIRLESHGPAFYRCLRLGRGGRELMMIKFRKMREGAAGPALAGSRDERFTRLGPFLARTKLDELPQLWHVLRGEMSLVGPRPEDPGFVELHRKEYDEILTVRPGITGLSQLAFARESEILDADDRINHYVSGILPQKVGIDQLYAARRSFAMDLGILWWTAAAVLFRREVAVHRETGRLNLRTPRRVLERAALQQGEAS